MVNMKKSQSNTTSKKEVKWAVNPEEHNGLQSLLSRWYTPLQNILAYQTAATVYQWQQL